MFDRGFYSEEAENEAILLPIESEEVEVIPSEVNVFEVMEPAHVLPASTDPDEIIESLWRVVHDCSPANPIELKDITEKAQQFLNHFEQPPVPSTPPTSEVAFENAFAVLDMSPHTSTRVRRIDTADSDLDWSAPGSPLRSESSLSPNESFEDLVSIALSLAGSDPQLNNNSSMQTSPGTAEATETTDSERANEAAIAADEEIARCIAQERPKRLVTTSHRANTATKPKTHKKRPAHRPTARRTQPSRLAKALKVKPVETKRTATQQTPASLMFGRCPPFLKKRIAKNTSTYQHREEPCHWCLTNSTSEWRMGPFGPLTLCNGCGIFYKKEAARCDRWINNQLTMMLARQTRSQSKRK